MNRQARLEAMLASRQRISTIVADSRRDNVLWSDDDDSSTDEPQQQEQIDSTTAINVVDSEASNKNNEKSSTLLDKPISTKRKRTPKPKLTVNDLVGSNGLAHIPLAFNIKYASVKSSTAASRQYLNQLFYAYKTYFEDTINKDKPPLEQHGDDYGTVFYNLYNNKTSGAQLKKYIQFLRQEQRRKYLEKLLGEDEATKLLHHLVQEHAQLQHDNEAIEESIDTNNVNAAANDDEEEAEFEIGNTTTTTEAFVSRVNAYSASRNAAIQDDDSENEFDADLAAADVTTDADIGSGQVNNAGATKKRRIVEDDEE